jgi:hypothetical protein
MKRLFVGFFQVLYILQIFGVGQLNAHPLDEQLFGTHAVHWKGSVPAHLAGANQLCTIQATPAVDSQINFRFIIEDVDEVEYELISSKKHSESTPYFIAAFYICSPEHICCNHKNSLAVCKQLTFISASSRYLIFQVFRI